MAITYDESTKTYQVSFYKRNPKTGQPVRAARQGIKTKAEANRVYTELVIQVEQKLHEKVVPKWGSLLEDYKKGPLPLRWTLESWISTPQPTHTSDGEADY